MRYLNRSFHIFAAMKFLCNFIIYISLFILSGSAAMGQEVLKHAKIQVKANRKHLPSLGIPEHTRDEFNGAIWYKDNIWNEADSIKAVPKWQMTVIDKESIARVTFPDQVMSLFHDWSVEKPESPLYVVWGPLGNSRYIAVCKKAKGSLNWKSIGFIYPEDGMNSEKRVWDYSCSVNWIEWLTGYDIFPKLPENLQEIVEEMTAFEHLCPFIEFDTVEIEGPELEIDYDWLDDQHEIQ